MENVLFNYDHTKDSLGEALGMTDDHFLKLRKVMHRTGDILFSESKRKSETVQDLAMAISGLSVDEISFVFMGMINVTMNMATEAKILSGLPKMSGKSDAGKALALALLKSGILKKAEGDKDCETCEVKDECEDYNKKKRGGK